MALNALGKAGGRPLSADILRQLLESSQDVLYAVSLNPLRMLYATPAFARRLGLPDDFLEQGYDVDAFLSSLHPDDRERFAQTVRDIMASRADADLRENPLTYRLRTPEGSFRVIQDFHRVLRGPDGTARTLIGNARDASGQNEARQALVENRARLLLLAENSRDLFFSMRFPGGCFEYLSPSYAEVTGFSPEEHYADPSIMFRVIAPAWREQVRQWLEEISRGEVQESYEFQILDRFGRLRWLNQRQVLAPGPDGQGLLLQGVATDVTELRQARQSLLENEARFLSLAENSRDIFFTMRLPEGRYEYINSRVTEIHGLTPQDFYDDPETFMRLCLAPAWREPLRTWMAEINQGQVREKYEFEVVDKDGRLRWIEQRLVLAPGPDGQGMLLHGVASDHTEEHQSSEALRQSEEHFRQLIEAWPEQVMLSVNLTKGLHEYVSPSMERVMGYAPQEFYDDPGLGMRVVAPQWREQAGEWIEQIRQGQLQPAYEFELVHKSGEHRFIHQVGALRPPAPGEDLVAQFTFRDITEERGAREVLSQSEARYRELAEGWTDQVVMRINLDTGRPEYVSPSMERLFGHTPETVLASPPERIVAPGWGEHVKQWLEENRQGIIRPEYQHEILDTRGNRHWVSARGTLVRDGQGKPRALQLALFDITERKRLEEELRTSRAFLDCIIEQSPVSMWISNASGTLIRANQALRTLFQVTEEEVVGRFNIFEDNQALELGLMPQIRRVYDEGGTTRFMLPYDTRRIEGLDLARASSAFLDVTISAVQDEHGRTTNLIVQHLDISEHKRTEDELRTSKAFLECIIEQSPMSMWISDENGTLIRTNQALRDRLQITDADVVGKFNIFADNQALEQGFMPQIRRVYEQGGTERFTLAYDTGRVHGLDLARPTRCMLDLTISAVQDECGQTSNLIIQHLDITEHKRLEAELSASERKYRSLHENMRDGFAAVDVNGFIIEHNKAFRDMLGYAEQEIAALTYEDITPARWHEAEARVLKEQVFVRGYSDVFEKEYIRKDGSVFPVSLRIYREADDAQSSVRLWAIVRDITESKRAVLALRESEERFRELVEGTQSLITQVDAAGRFTYVNPMVRTLLGLEPEDCLGRLATEIIHPDDHESSTVAYLGWVERRLTHTTHENRLLSVTGEVRHVSWSIHFQYDADGKVTVIDSIARDITELKRTEETLRKNEALLGSMLRNLPFDFWARDISQQIILQSEESIRLWGDLTKASPTHARFDEQTLAHWRANNSRAMAGQIVSEECAYTIKSGAQREFHNIVAPIRDGEDILGLIGVNIDITERKRNEEALRESEERFRLIVVTANEGIWTINAQQRATFVNPAMAKMLGYTIQEMLQAPSEVFIFPEDWGLHTRRMAQRRAGHDEVYERRFRRKDGTALWTLASAKPLMDKDGNYVGAFGMFMDITERKRAEAALHETNARYALLADNVVDVIWTTDADLSWTYLSPSAERLSGLPLSRLMAMRFDQLFTQESMVMIAGLMARRQATTAPGEQDEAYRVEMDLRHADGSLVPLEVLVRPMRGKEGEITGYCGTSRDITERKLVEEALRKSEESYRQLAESWTEHVIMRINLRTMLYEYVSPSVERLFGYTPEQYLQADPAVLGAVAPEWRAQVAQWAQEAAAGVLQPEYEYEVYDAWGQRRWVYQRGALLRDAAGAPIAVQFLLSDVTERKRMEAALTLIQERYDLALRGANDGIWDWDLLQGEVYYSDRWMEIIGYAPDELRHDVEEWTSRIHPEDFDRVMAANMRCVSGQTTIFQVEYRLRHKDGHYCWIFGRGAALANASGRVVRVAGAHTDITGRKQAEEALFKSERLSRKLLESMHEGVWAVDADRRTIFVNDRLCAMLGYASAELMNMTPTDVLEWPQPPSGKRLSDLESGNTSATDFVLMRKDGTKFPAHVVSSPIVEEQGRFEGLVCGVVDLTERARMEHELRRNQARFEALYELSRLSPATEQQLAAFTLREAIRLTDSAAGVLFFVSDDDKSLEPKAWETGAFMTRGQIPGFPASGQLPWALVVQNGLPLLINEYSQSAHLVPPGHPAVTRFLGVPALDSLRSAAVLCLTDKAEPYTAEDTLQTTLLLDGMWREVRTRRDEERIRASLREKDALLHEVHHRVKNNLQVISSLMDMAGRRLSNPEARQTLEELRGKVQAMSLIHAQLHGVGIEGGISLERFVRALFNQLREVYSGGLTLSLVVELSNQAMGLALGLDQAVPLGLALNEALTNVFKHASTEARPGRVDIRAGQDCKGHVCILVRDDGPGLPLGLDPARAQSLGMKLMHGLVRHQLGGQLEVVNCLPPEHSGVEVCICFRSNIAR